MFWTAAFTIGSHLNAMGFGWLGLALVLAWLLLMIPGSIVHALVIVDAGNYAFTGRVVLLPTLFVIAKKQADRREKAGPDWLEAISDLTTFAANTSPLWPIACWCLLIVARTPESARVVVNPPTVRTT